MVPGDYASELRDLLCAVFGADDESVPMETAEQLGALLAQEGHIVSESHVPLGHHMFANESRRRYPPESAETAWGFVPEFFALHLTDRDGVVGLSGR